MKRKDFFKIVTSIAIIGMFLIFAFGSGKESELKEDETYCQECGKHFKIGTGWNTHGDNQYGQPDDEISHFCSKECAYEDVIKRRNR